MGPLLKIDLQNKQLIGRGFVCKCSHTTIRPALPGDFFALPKIRHFFLSALNWIQGEINQNKFWGFETFSLLSNEAKIKLKAYGIVMLRRKIYKLPPLPQSHPYQFLPLEDQHSKMVS